MAIGVARVRSKNENMLLIKMLIFICGHGAKTKIQLPHNVNTYNKFIKELNFSQAAFIKLFTNQITIYAPTEKSAGHRD